MPQYFSPGVYVEEVDAGPKPIEGVSTSVAGAVGVTVRGPTAGKPTLCTSFNEFQRIFGGYLPEPDAAIVNRWAANIDEGGRWWQFPLTIKGFFDNGGQQLFVKRVFASTSTSASARLGRGLVLEVARDAAATDTVLTLRHVLGIEAGTEVRIIADGMPLTGTQFFVGSFDADAGTVNLVDAFPNGNALAVGQELRAGRDLVELVANPQSARTPAADLNNPNNVTLTFSAKARGEWGNELRARVRPMVGAALRLQADPVNGGAPARTTVAVEAAAGATNVQVASFQGFVNGDRVLIGGNTYTISNVPPLATTAISTAANQNDQTIEVDSVAGLANGEVVAINGAEYTISNVSTGLTTTVAAVANAGDTTITVASVNGFANGETVEIDGNTYTISNVTAGPPATFDVTPAVPAGATWAVGTTVRRVQPTININPVTPAAGFAVGDAVQEMPAATTTVAAVANAGDTTITVAGVAGLANGGSVFIAGIQYTLSNVTAGPPATIDIAPAVPGGATWAVGTPVRVVPPSSFDIAPAAPTTWPAGTAVRRLRVANQVSGGGTEVLQIRAQGANRLYPGAILELSNGTNKERFTVASINGNTITFAGATGLTRQYFEDDKVRLIEAEVNIQYAPGGAIDTEETFTNLRLIDDGGVNYVVTHVNEQSDLVNVVRGDAFSETDALRFPVSPTPAAGTTPMPTGLWQTLTGGQDNLNDLTADDFVGVDGGSGSRTGIQALEDIDDISICLVPGIWAGTVRDAVITHCETLRYRMAILDPPDGLDIQEIRTFREPIDTKYAALYYPWISVRNASTARFETVAPSAHMAGIYARVDTERGVHKAPANEVIRGIRGVNPAKGTAGIVQEVTKREQDLLNPDGINALRYFPGRGQRVWGARTLSSDSDWKYVNVRRTFIFIERSIDEGTQWVVFEPNDASTWARVRQTVANFLNTQWRNGILEGATPDEAYYVACDRGVTMTQAEIENGLLICEVGIAPVYPAEFVVFRIQKYTAESKLQ